MIVLRNAYVIFNSLLCARNMRVLAIDIVQMWHSVLFSQGKMKCFLYYSTGTGLMSNDPEDVLAHLPWAISWTVV